MGKVQVELEGTLYGQQVKVKVEALGKCPKCGGWVFDPQKTFKGEPAKAYSCQGFFTKTCDFGIWKEFSGKQLSEETVIELLEKGKTEKPVEKLVSQKGTIYSSRLMIDPIDHRTRLLREEQAAEGAHDGSEE